MNGLIRMFEATQRLYEKTVKGSKFETQIKNFISSDEDLDAWTRRLYLVDRGIGGIGVHNVNRLESGGDPDNPWITGTYHIEDRSIFRPIQYCATVLLRQFIAVDTRYLVDNSCGHIESILKRILVDLTGSQRIEKPMGAVISDLCEENEFRDRAGSEILAASRAINEVYRSAKHDFDYDYNENSFLQSSPLDLESHLFSYEEAAISYFGCRMHGMLLMEWMRDRGIEPTSLSPSGRPSWDEFAAVAHWLSQEIRLWNPEFIKGGKRSPDGYSEPN